MNALLPDQLKSLWKMVEAERITPEHYETEHERLIGEYKQVWTEALLLEGQQELKNSLLAEVGMYVGCDDLAEIERRCQRGMDDVKAEWERSFRAGDLRSAEQFYDESRAYIYDLTWWHTLWYDYDLSPLAYVLALRFAMAHGCRYHLDFGAGAGAGSLLFARHGFQIALADISTSLLRFSKWRLDLRKIPAQLLNLKTDKLPEAAFDIITAMDVFEHLVDPTGTIEALWRALKPGGFLAGRFEPKTDTDYPQHIVADFEPTFRRMNELGLVEVWRDEWLWGHQVFQKT